MTMFPTSSDVNSPLPNQYSFGLSPSHRSRSTFAPLSQFDLNGYPTNGAGAGAEYKAQQDPTLLSGGGVGTGGSSQLGGTALAGLGTSGRLSHARGSHFDSRGATPHSAVGAIGTAHHTAQQQAQQQQAVGAVGHHGVGSHHGIDFGNDVRRSHAAMGHSLGPSLGGTGTDDGVGFGNGTTHHHHHHNTATAMHTSSLFRAQQYYPPPRHARRIATPQRGSLLGADKAQISSLDIRYDPPVENSVIQPYVSLKDENDNHLFLADLGELKYKWFRGAKRICSANACGKGATLQCMVCLKLKVPSYLSFFCSVEHLQKMWPYHRQMHRDKDNETPNKEPSISWNDLDECDSEDEWQFALSKEEHDRGDRARQGKNIDSHEALSRKFPPLIQNIWAECGHQRTYTPDHDDIGRQLKLECVPMRPTKGAQRELGSWVRKETSPVLPEPDPPPPRRFVQNAGVQNQRIPPRDTFKTMSYNVLAESYATQTMYNYCPMRYLCWNYRRNIIMRDISKYDCDIVCLQEVQQNHYDEFFQPEMNKRNYEGIYKMKTREPMGEEQVVDGCAVFYKKDRFAVMEQYAIEFNEAAKGSFENTPGDWRAKLRRLSKGNVALVCVLEELRSDSLGRNRRKRRICVANTHIYWDPNFSDVKLWQTWILCQELQKMVLGRDLPLLLCGDFNSTPESPVYELLSTERIRDDHDLLANDEYGIFTQGELTHQLPLVSAYGSVFGAEPKYTNFTQQFSGCLDYIFYSKNHLQVCGVLDIDSDDVLKENTALPSPRFASDHIAIVSEFAFV